MRCECVTFETEEFHRRPNLIPQNKQLLSPCIQIVRIAISLLFVSGCSEPASSGVSALPADAPVAIEVQSARPPIQDATASTKSSRSAPLADNSFDFKPLTLNSLPQNPANGGDESVSTAIIDPEQQIQAIIAQLKPLQVLLGQWRGTTRREYENFKAVDTHEWVWDLRTRPDRPALTIKSDKSPYLKSGSLSWDPALDTFTLATADASGVTRQFTGEFSEPVHEIVGSDDKLHRVFRLEFTETESQSSGDERWQLAFAQQENNRYLLEVSKRRGSAQFTRFDTVSTQREGTSFAVSDSGYAEKTCIISEGLGTTELTYKGRSYWVCCTGCKAAFEEDPEKWIARAATRPAKP